MRGVRAGTFRSRSAFLVPSITVSTLTPGASVLAHVCLFRARWGCTPDAALETWATLPPSPSEGALDATISLTLATFGAMAGTRGAPESARLGRPIALPRWLGADPVPCRDAAQPGEACIEGGASWIGNPLVTSADPSLALRRLVVLAPFFLDRSEVSVASYRRVLGANPPGVGHFSGHERGDNLHDYCTFTEAVGPNEDLPVNCLPLERGARVLPGARARPALRGTVRGRGRGAARPGLRVG